MKIIINDLEKEKINNNVIHKENVIKNRLKKEYPELNTDNISVDFSTGKITYYQNNNIYNIGYIKQNRKHNEEIYLTTTEIRMILRDSKTKINDEIVDNKTITEEIKDHIPESKDKVLELHTHFIEVLDGKTFFELLVKNDPYFVDPDNKNRYLVTGKSYSKEELIKSLEYPLEHLSGTKKENNGKGIKTLAFSELSRIVSLRTNILKRNPIKIKGNDSESNDSKKYKYGKEIEEDRKSILVARIRELFIESIKKLENEGVNYVELSYSRGDISTIFDEPTEPEEVLEPSKPINPTEEEQNKYLKELEKYDIYLKEKNKYKQELKNYNKFIDELEKIKQRNKIDYRFLLSTQREDWQNTTINNNYCIPTNGSQIITHFINKLTNLKDAKERKEILNELINNFIDNIDETEFIDTVKNRVESIMNKNKANRIYEEIEFDKIFDKNILLKKAEKALDQISKTTKRDSIIIVLYNILYEELAYIHEISSKYPKELNLDSLFKKEEMKSEHIVGYDIMGYETKMSKGEEFYLKQKIYKILNEYKADDATSIHSNKRVIRIHAGETRESSGNVLKVLKIIKEIKNTPNYKDIFDKFEFRIGHGVFIYDEQKSADEVVDLLVELGVIVEINLSSNYALDNVDKITDVPILRYRKGSNKHSKDVKYVVSTDGGGVYKTTVLQEGLLEHRYFPYPKSPKHSSKSNSNDEKESLSKDSTNNNEILQFPNKKYDKDIRINESNNNTNEQVINEYKNLLYIFYKDFSIDNILNNEDISSRMGDIENSIRNHEYKKSKINIISCQLLMDSSISFKETYKNMLKSVNETRRKMRIILKSNKIKEDSRIYATIRQVSQMSNRELLINYYNYFEKGELNKLLDLVLMEIDYSKRKAQNDNSKLFFNELSNDIDNIFIPEIKSKFDNMDEDTLNIISENILLKEGENREDYINNLIDIIIRIKNSNNDEHFNLKHSLLAIDLNRFIYEIESKSNEEINEFVRDVFIKNKTAEELSYILSLRYMGLLKSGNELSIEEFMKGEYGYGNNKGIKI